MCVDSNVHLRRSFSGMKRQHVWFLLFPCSGSARVLVIITSELPGPLTVKTFPSLLSFLVCDLAGLWPVWVSTIFQHFSLPLPLSSSSTPLGFFSFPDRQIDGERGSRLVIVLCIRVKRRQCPSSHCGCFPLDFPPSFLLITHWWSSHSSLFPIYSINCSSFHHFPFQLCSSRSSILLSWVSMPVWTHFHQLKPAIIQMRKFGFFHLKWNSAVENCDVASMVPILNNWMNSVN